MPDARAARAAVQALIVVALVALAAGCASVDRRYSQEAIVEQLMAHYRQWQGTPYRIGGTSRQGVDCSAYVQSLYRDLYGVRLPRSTRDQEDVGSRVGRDKLRGGDLVFFKTGWAKRHVGVYVGNGRFIHASESRGVTESSLSSPYWSRKYWKARRVI